MIYHNLLTFDTENQFYKKFIEEIERNCNIDAKILWNKIINIIKTYKDINIGSIYKTKNNIILEKYTLKISTRVEDLIKTGGLENTLAVYMIYDSMFSGGQMWSFHPFSLFGKYFHKGKYIIEG